MNEAFSAGSLDASSTIVPAAMDRVALGAYVAEQFDGPMMRCLAAQLVVFSGLKIDKLDDLEAMIGRGSAKLIFTAGSLAMALKKAEAELAGKSFSLGVAEDPAHGDKPYFIPRERIEQAKRMLAEGRKKGIEFVLPVDFVLQDGRSQRHDRPGRSAVRRRPGKLARCLPKRSADLSPRRVASARSRSTTACSACSRTRGSRRARASSSAS